MTPRQLQPERRCTLTHELIHIECGHSGCQPPAVELEVRVEAARRLIPLDDRLTHLTEDERAEINAALARRDARDAKPAVGSNWGSAVAIAISVASAAILPASGTRYP